MNQANQIFKISKIATLKTDWRPSKIMNLKWASLKLYFPIPT